MKNKWSKLLLAAPVAATAVLPITLLTGCNENDGHTCYIRLTDSGQAWIEALTERHLQAKLEPENFPAYFESELKKAREDDPDYMQTTLDAALESSWGKEAYRLRFKQHTAWENHHATYTITPVNGNYGPVVFFLHGGGYAKNINYIHINSCMMLCDKLNAKFYVPLHPILPQDDVVACYEFLENAYADMCENEPGRDIIFMGDSSGGGLALAFSQYLYNKHTTRMPCARILFSPWVDVTMKNQDLYKYLKNDIMLHPFGLEAYGYYWANGKWSRDDYRISPINGEFEDKIRTLIFCGGREIFRPDVTLLHKKLLKNGCESELVIGEKLFHDFELWDSMYEAQEVFNKCLYFINHKPVW